MKFLILTQYFPPEIGAAPTRLLAFSAELRSRGHEVEVVTSLPSYPRGRIFPEYRGCLYRREVREGNTLHRVWIYPALGRGIDRILNYGSFVVSSLAGLALAAKPDYLFLESPPLFLAVSAVLWSRLWRVPLIMNVADLWPDAVVEAGILEKGVLVRLLLGLERWSYRRASFINAVTLGIRDHLVRNKSVPIEKILFLPNGVDVDRFQPGPPDEALKKKLGLDGKKIVLWPGTLGQSHALEHIIEAAALIQRRKEIHFLFVGDGTVKPNLVRLSREMHLSNVTFHDPVPLDQLPSFFSIAECGLASLRDIPIHTGARPSKLLPMMASAKPVVFVGRGEGARLIEQAQAGVIVAPGDPQALASALETFLNRSDLLDEMGRNGRHFVQGHLSWSETVADWIEQLRRSDSRYRHTADELNKKHHHPKSSGGMVDVDNGNEISAFSSRLD